MANYNAYTFCPCGDAAVDAAPPVVTAFTPANGLLADPRDPVGFDVTDNVGLRRTHVLFDVGGRRESVHDGNEWSPGYTGSISAISGGFRYSVTRAGGFPRGSIITVRVAPVDTSGNEP